MRASIRTIVRPELRVTGAATLLICLLSILSSCAGDYRWNQKVTIEIEKAGRHYTGSSITTVTTEHRFWEMFGIRRRSDVRGEAPLVDLGEGGVVVAALRDMDMSLAMTALWPRIESVLPEEIPAGNEATNAALSMLAASDWNVALKPDDMPMLLYFPDPARPSSVKLLDPQARTAGVRVVSVTLELVDEQVTSDGLDAVPWVLSLGNRRLDGRDQSVPGAPISNTVYRNDFIRD